MKIFEQYVRKYDMNNINIKARYFHSLKVMEIAKDLATELGIFTDEEIAYLYENAFIIDDDFDERDLLKYMFNKSFYSDDFLNIVLVPGLECNFKCPYCFEKIEDKYERDISDN